MGARGRRDEVVALLLLVALAAAIAVVGALTGGPGSGVLEDDPTPAATTSASPTPEPVGAGVVLWDDPFVYGCRLLPPSDVERIFGDSGPKAYVRQQYLDRSPTTAELQGASAFAYGGLSTRCSYWFDDRAGHSLDLVVTQFPSARLTDRRWRRLDGRAVPGTDGSLTYLRSERAFAIRADRVVVQARLTQDGDDRAEGPLPERRYAAQVPQMRQVRDAVELYLGDGSALAGPLPVNESVTGTVGGTPYVEPCAVLDQAAFEALGAPAPEPVLVDTSVITHDPYADAAVTSCERSVTVRPGGPRSVRSTFAVLEIRVAPDPATAREVLERHLAERYSTRVEPTPLDTDAGTAYVVDLAGTRKGQLRTQAVHVVVGAYEMRLAAVRDVGPRRPAGRAPTTAQLASAVDALATSLAEATAAAADPVP